MLYQLMTHVNASQFVVLVYPQNPNRSGQVSEYQDGGMPFGLGDGLALTIVYVPIKPQAILKLHHNEQIPIPLSLWPPI